MARRGRKPTGTQLVERLEGSAHAKSRMKTILETLSGQRTIPDACAELGIQESMFHRLRAEVLQTALGRLEPRPLGRPPRPSSAEAERVAELEAEILHLKIELKAAEVRRELAENLPRLAKPGSAALPRTEEEQGGRAGSGGVGKKTPPCTAPPRRRRRPKRAEP